MGYFSAQTFVQSTFACFSSLVLAITSLISLRFGSNSINSSKEILYVTANFFDWLMSGKVSSSSHFEIVCLLTPSFSATSSCDKPLFFRALKKFVPNVMMYPSKLDKLSLAGFDIKTSEYRPNICPLL